LLARHYTEVGLIEKAADFWSKAGLRSLARSALVEAIEQLSRALNQIATLPSTPALRRIQVELQVALITPLMHVKGYAAAETKLAAERARVLLEHSETLGERPEDPLLLFSVLYSIWVANYVAFNGDVIRELAEQFLSLAEKQEATVPRMIAHRLMAQSLMLTGQIVKGREHYDNAIEFYDKAQHRLLAARFGQDVGVAILSYRALAQWVLGYADTALEDVDHAIDDAREIGQAATLMYALGHAGITLFQRGDYSKVIMVSDELIDLADQKGAVIWKALGMKNRGCALAVTGKLPEAVDTITSALVVWWSTGTTVWAPLFLSNLAMACADLGRLDEARRWIGEATAAMDKTREKCAEAEVKRISGEIALLAPQFDAPPAEASFEHALAIARAQQAKSWELRAATSMARLWRDQGKVSEARELLAPVYGWFAEGFDTLDLKEAKALLQELEA
jgi:predicted ATPase